MPTTRPTDTPDWASSAPAGAVIEPSTSKQIAGFVVAEIPTFQLLNWAWNRFASWVAHVSGSVSTFVDPLAMFTATLPGDSAPIALGDTAMVTGTAGRRRGETMLSSVPVAGITNYGRLAASGRSLAWIQATAADIQVRSRAADLVGPIVTYATIALGTDVRGLLNDGRQIAFAVDDEVRVYDHDTAVLQWSASVGASSVNALAWDETRVYAVSANAGQQLRAFRRSDGVLLYSFDHNGILLQVAVSALRVFVYGFASGHASAARLRGLIASNGFDATGEGGLGSSDRAWNNTAVGVTVGVFGLVADGRELYAANDDQIWKIGLVDGAIAATRTFVAALSSNGGFDALTLDQDFVIFGIDDATPYALWAINRQGFATAWLSEEALTADARVHDSDGHTVYFAESGDDSIHRISRGTDTRLWRYVDPTSSSFRDISWRRVIIPAQDSLG
jgi:hypothetical protein